MEEIMIGIIFWFIGSFIILLSYGRSVMIGRTTDTEHMAILLVCLPATITIVIIQLGIEIIDFIKDKWN